MSNIKNLHQISTKKEHLYQYQKTRSKNLRVRGVGVRGGLGGDIAPVVKTVNSIHVADCHRAHCPFTAKGCH